MTSPEYTLDELANETGIPARTLRSWVQKMVLPKPRGSARAARYGVQHVLRARMVERLRAEGGSLTAIRAQLAPLSEAQLQALLSAPMQSFDGLPLPPPEPSYPSVSWEVVNLAEGLVLMVNTARGPLLRRVANEIYRHYGAPIPRRR